MINNAALKISYDFPFFSDEELEEVFQAHEKVYFQKGDFMLKKTISSLMTLLAALLLASCAPSHSTNNQTTTSSTEVAKKNEILAKFNAMGDATTLKSKYGIPFNDWWILQREY